MHLYLSSNPIRNTGMNYIRDLIRNNRNLQHLSLDDIGILDRGIQIVIDVLSSNSPSIRCLDLRSNEFIIDESVDFLHQIVK
ncbi:unnamed protein product [Rotaria sordida]|uniref:Uncharacterized protein n=1 Tax=Rotaria sordida TaxID=392033 RepID=A0A814UVV5_9BILA|nr:unnamed protein product [Rotaria sordida]CAF1442390.1 unnamed protein product [Rotaria sordida]